MRRILLLLLLDAAVSGGAAAYVYLTRGADAALMAGLSIFIAASPICLILASPFTLYLTGRKLAELGVTLHKSDALKILAEVNVVALPYNRVLTDGAYYVTDLVPSALSQAQLLTMAASAERDAQNIFGRIIYDTAVSRALQLQKATDFRELPGRGVEATIQSVTVRVGNPAWLESVDVSIGANFRTRIDQLLVRGKTVVVVATGRITRGIIALKDESSPAAKKFLGELLRGGLETLLLTSQPKKMAHRIEKEFALTHIRTNLTPESKAREVQIFRAKGNVVAVIGTDVQDLPALAGADVSLLIRNEELGISNDDFKPDFELPTLESFLPVKNISRKVVNVLKLNRRLALASWVVTVPPALLSAFDLLPITFHPLMSVADVAIFSALILTNSLRSK